MPPILLTIAGFDPSTGAGVTADLQVFAANEAFATSCITALTVQSTRGVAHIQPVSGDLIRETLEHLHADLPPVGVKIGMLGSAEAVSAVADYLEAHPPAGPVVLDPVMVSSSGAELLQPEAVEILLRRLLPLVSWITPNTEELAALTGVPVTDIASAESVLRAAGKIWPQLHIVCTGGHFDPTFDLLLTPSGEVHRFPGEKIATTSTHGTGCAFSSALTAKLASGESATDAVRGAKEYVAEAIRRAPKVGSGRGPLNLLWPLQAASED